MEPTVDLAPGAEDNPLAVEIAGRIRDNVARSARKAADLRGMRASVLMVAEDLGESFTLRFDHGRLTVHDGGAGIPSVTFCGSADALRLLGESPLGRWLRLPARGTLWELTGMLARGDLKVYGLVSHPRTVVLLLRVLSAQG